MDLIVDFQAKLRNAADMGKYDPLQFYLKRQTADEVELSFREIENLIRSLLPNGASQPEWWTDIGEGFSNPHVQHKAWLEAGYEARLLKTRDRVKFMRALS